MEIQSYISKIHFLSKILIMKYIRKIDVYKNIHWSEDLKIKDNLCLWKENLTKIPN